MRLRDYLLNHKKRSYKNALQLLRNESGIAFAMVLVLSVILLAIMTGLIYMITTSTQISGTQKRYKTALEAAKGGSDVAFQFIATRGDTSTLLGYLSSISPSITTSGSCTGTNKAGGSYTGFSAKLNSPTTTWAAACDGRNLSIIPGTTTSYDLQYDFGSTSGSIYRVYAKIVDTVEGNTGGDEGLLKSGVVSSNTGEVLVMAVPYLYTMEVDAQNISSPAERAKLSVLYQY